MSRSTEVDVIEACTISMFVMKTASKSGLKTENEMVVWIK